MSVLRMTVLTMGSLAAAALAVAAGAATSPGTVTTKSYKITVSLGEVEPMYTKAQVAAKHPKAGEVMLMGSMGPMGSGSMGSQHHLEVHIRQASTGKVVAGAHPAITILDLTARNAMPVKVPFAEMQGVTEGSSDIHYGNNVDVVGGHTYQVTVSLNGQTAKARVTVPSM